MTTQGQYDDPATEHIFELGFVKQIIEAAIQGKFLRKGLKSGPIDIDFFKWVLTKRPRNPPLQNGQKRVETSVIKRIMYTLGTGRNKEHFVVVDGALNSYKMNVRRRLPLPHSFESQLTSSSSYGTTKTLSPMTR